MKRATNEKLWSVVDIHSAPDVSDYVATEVAEAFGVGTEITGGGVRFYVEGESLNRDQRELLTNVLTRAAETFGLDESLSFEESVMAGDDWADRWKEYFKPLRVGKRFLICPTWEREAAVIGPEDRLILMDPGRAFGTGQHETTRLCLEWMEEWAETHREREEIGRMTLLDVGTGSGILAMGAALLGFKRVTGVDNDPEAVEVARENVTLNDLSGKVTLLEATDPTEALRSDDLFDVLVSNIQLHPLVEMAPQMAACLKTPGFMALSGILREQEDEVRRAYEGEALRFCGTKTAGEWVLLAFEK